MYPMVCSITFPLKTFLTIDETAIILLPLTVDVKPMSYVVVPVRFSSVERVSLLRHLVNELLDGLIAID